MSPELGGMWERQEYKGGESGPQAAPPMWLSCSTPAHPTPAWDPPAPLAKQEEEHTEDDAGDPNVDADDDARGGRLVGGLVLPTVTRWAQGWGAEAEAGWGLWLPDTQPSWVTSPAAAPTP